MLSRSVLNCNLLRFVQSFRVETLNRLSHVLPASSCSLTVLTRCRQAAPPGVSIAAPGVSVSLPGVSLAAPGVSIAAPGVRGSSRIRNRQMPKKEESVKEQATGGGAAQTDASAPVSRDKGGCVTITVRAKPRSKHSCITEVSAEAVGVAVAAPATDGEANAELVRYLAEVLGLKKSNISLDKGSRSRDKVVRVDSPLSPDQVLRRLREAAG